MALLASGVVALLAGCNSSTPAAGQVARPSATSGAPGGAGTAATPPSLTRDAAGRFALPTSDWTPGSFSMLAEIQGELITDERGCLRIRAPGLPAAGGAQVAWPRGYSARRTGLGVELLDASGSVVARAGQFIATAGGFGGGTVDDPAGCAGDYPWYVQSEIKLMTDPDSLLAMPSDATPSRMQGPG